LKRIRYESDNGYNIEFADKEPYILENINGNGLTGEANSVKIPGRDGKKTYNLTRSSRNIEISCAILSKGDKSNLMKQSISENREYAARCFDPRYFGTLYYYAFHGDKGKKIRCRPTGIPAFENDFNNLLKFKLGFESDGAMWEKVEVLYAALGVTRNNYRFPYFMGAPSAFAYIYAEAIIYNPTLYDIYPVVTVYNSVIPVHVKNIDTGTFLKFKVPTGINKRLVIDVKNATAILEENINDKWVFKQNIIHYLTLDSRLTDFVIAPGKNEFKISTVEGQPESPVLVITANETVMGV